MSQEATRAGGLARYQSALERSNQLIESIGPDLDMSLAAVNHRAVERMERLARFLDEIGDPHLQCPVVHVTGTSGKGSTSVAIASILDAVGKNVGLYTSPYLQSATEKIQIGGRLIGPDDFADLVDELLALSTDRKGGPLSYAEFWFAFAALAFARAGVDYAVIEVGAGGRFDVTNLVCPSVSVITSVGLDHTETLGPTVRDIAWHKAGIIKAGAPVVTGVFDPEAFALIAAEARGTGSRVIQLREGRDYSVARDGAITVEWRDAKGRTFPTGMPGRFQAGNAALAVAAVQQIPGIVAGDSAIRQGLLAARLPGRFEIVQRDPLIVLDGAHNPEKVAALAGELPNLLRGQGKLIAVVGSLAAKDHLAIVDVLAGQVDALILTSPRVLAKPAAAAADLARDARLTGFEGAIEIAPDPNSALDLALERAGRDDVILVTGSLYLLGNLRGRWFPDADVTFQRTPWPRRGSSA